MLCHGQNGAVAEIRPVAFTNPDVVFTESDVVFRKSDMRIKECDMSHLFKYHVAFI